MTAHRIKVSPVNALNEHPCVVQVDILDMPPQRLYAEVERALVDADSASLVSLLHHMAAKDLEFAAKSDFLNVEKLSETVPSFLATHYSEHFPPEEAMAWGHFIGYWMANKQNPDRHYWMMNFIHEYAVKLAGDLRLDQLSMSSAEGHRQLVSVLCTHLDDAKRVHHISPLSVAFIDEFQLTHYKNDSVIQFMISLENQPLLDSFMSEVFKLFEEGSVRSWVSLANLMCTEPVCPALLSSVSVASVSHGFPAEGFLFDALKRCLGRGVSSGNLLENMKVVQDFMVSNKDRILPLAGHILTADHLKTIKEKLNLDLQYFFKPEDLPPSARRLVLETDLGM